MEKTAIERKIRYLQREMVRNAACPQSGRAALAQSLMRAMAQERQLLRRVMNHEST